MAVVAYKASWFVEEEFSEEELAVSAHCAPEAAGGRPVMHAYVSGDNGEDVSYQWQSSSAGAGFADIAGATEDRYAPDADTGAGGAYRVVASTADGRSAVSEPVTLTEGA